MDSVLQPIPASSHIICTASLDSIEGRKTWVRAVVKDRPDGVEYAAGKALFVIPKKHPLNTATDGGAEEDRAHAAGKLQLHAGCSWRSATSRQYTNQAEVYHAV